MSYSYEDASEYFPRAGKVSQAYYTQKMIKCRCKSVQKNVNLKNAGIEPPPYDVSTVYTEPIDASYTDLNNYYTGEGDFTNNRGLKKSFPKYITRRRRKMQPIFRESLSQTHRDIKPLEKVSYSTDTSKKSINRMLKRKTIADCYCGSKKYDYNHNPEKKRVREKKLEHPPCKCLKIKQLMDYKSLNITTNEEIKRHPSSFTKKFKKTKIGNNINSSPVKSKFVDEKPHIRFEIKPKSFRDKNDKIQQIFDKSCKKDLCWNAFNTSKSFDCSGNYSKKNNLQGSGDVPERSRKENCKTVCTFSELSNTEKDKIPKTITKKKKTCDQCLCFIAPKQARHKRICECVKNNLQTEPTECTDTTCNTPRISTTTVGIKNKIICLCHKYSQLLREKERKYINRKNVKRDDCESGLCMDTSTKRKEFICKCTTIPSVNECLDEPCNLSRKVSNYLNKKKLLLQTRQLRTIRKEQERHPPPLVDEKAINKDHGYNCLYRCLKSKFTLKCNNKNPIEMAPQKILNDNKQTGKPVFEIKVDTNNMCVLNSDEIKNKVTALGTLKKVNSCICPSHDLEKKRFLQKLACMTCEKAYTKTNTDFECKCLSSRRQECSDETCSIVNNAKTLTVQQNEPYLEVRLDSDNLCILNSEDIQKKINLLDSPCTTGICKDTAKNNARYICKCFQRKPMEINECSDETCGSIDKLKIRKKRNNRMGRSKPDTKQLNSIKSKLSFICAHIRRESENCRNKIRKKRKRKIDLSDAPHERKSVQTHNKGNNLAVGDEQMTKTVGQETSRINKNLLQKQILNCDNLVCTKLAKCACCQCNFKNKTLWCKSLFSCNKNKYVVNKNIHRRNGLSLPSIIKTSKVKDQYCFCCICGENKQNCGCKDSLKTVRFKQIFCNSCLALIKKYPTHIKRHRKNGSSASLSKMKELNNGPTFSQVATYQSRHKKKIKNICLCSHICKCGVEKGKKQKSTNKKKISKNKVKQQKLQKRNQRKQQKRELRSGAHKTKINQRIARKKRKALLTDEKKFQKQLKKKERTERKKKEKLFQIQKKQLEAISKGKEQAEETSCLADFFLGLLKCGVAITKKVIFVVFKIITDPKGSYRYTRQRIQDPVGTYERVRKVFADSWRIKKLQMLRSIGGSEKMTILSDTFQDTAIFQAFADKGKTKKEKRRIQEQNKKRKWRIQKRDKEALHGCRHMLLHTLRKHPCLWVYHICPNFYPQCLSLVAFIKHFAQILLFLLALLVWTPCILCVEVARGMMCCLLCTR